MLKKLYDNDYHRLRRLAFSMAGNECEDLVQDAFIKMIPYQHLSYSEAQALITTIVKNKCFDWMRHDKTIKKYRQNMPEPVTVTPPSYSLDGKDLRTQVSRLPAYTRLVIELRFFEDMTLRDIGTIVGKDHATVYSQIRAGLRKLKPVV
jgi:RNA polymerase sigma factor (sigma-70 family)